MKDGIDSILTIDKKTRDLVEETDTKIEKIRSDLREHLTDMENKSIEDAKKLGQEKSQEVIDDFDVKVNNLKEENKNRLAEIQSFYEDHEEEILDEAFKLLVDENAR